MSSNIKNIKKAIGNTIGAATSTVAVTTEAVADSSGLLANSIASTPAVLKALLVSPFSAAKGYLIEAEGLSEEQAQAAAFHYLNQSVATTIAQTSEGVGKLTASLFEDDEDPITTVEKQQEVTDK